MSCLSDLKLDQLVRGELPSPEEARAHIDGCEKCKARLKSIEESRAAWLAENPRLKKRSIPWVAAGMGLAAAAGLLLFFRAPPPRPERLKGGTQLTLFVQHGGRTRPAGPGELVSPGDTLQFTYSLDKPQQAAVLSLDGKNRASIYFPDGSKTVQLEPGQDQALPRSTVLDDVLGVERLYGLFCEQPLDLEPLRAQLQKYSAMPILEHCRVIQLSIEKK